MGDVGFAVDDGGVWPIAHRTLNAIAPLAQRLLSERGLLWGVKANALTHVGLSF